MLHSSMKCVPLSADSENSTPLLATHADQHPVDPREPRDQRRRVAFLELVEPRAVHEPRDHLAHVVALAHDRRARCRTAPRGRSWDLRRRWRLPAMRLADGQRADDGARDLERVRVVVGEVVGDARQARVHVGAAKLLGRDVLARGGLHERRSAEKDGAGALDDHRLVRHRRHVRAAGRARAHHDGNLRQTRPPTFAPGCRRCGRSGRDRGRPRPASAGTRRLNRPGRRRAGDWPSPLPGRAGVS